MPHIVVTGTFDIVRPDGRRIRFMRDQLVQLCDAVGWRLQATVHAHSTEVVYAENIHGSSSKLRAAQRYAIPVRDYHQLYAELYSALTYRNGPGGNLRPEEALRRLQQYGSAYTTAPSTHRAIPVEHAQGFILPGGRSMRHPPEEVQQVARSTPNDEVATFGSLSIKRKVKL